MSHTHTDGYAWSEAEKDEWDGEDSGREKTFPLFLTLWLVYVITSHGVFFYTEHKLWNEMEHR